MNDLDRIREIEEAFGFSLNRVELDNLFEEKKFYTHQDTGVRNYSVDESGIVTGLALDFSPVNLLPNNFLSNFDNLQKIRLKNSNLPDYSFIKNLKSLRLLDLSKNQISDYSFIKELKSLTSLSLSKNQISDISFIKELKSLTSLDLSFNDQINDYSVIKELESLISLNLWNNKISNTSFLEELKLLTKLVLRGNEITNGSFAKKIQYLTYLDLSFNQISDISFIKELKSLTSLDLSFNQISDISFIKELKSLTSLDLGNIRVSDYSFIKDLKSLTSLDLGLNNIDDASFVQELKSLTRLALGTNKLRDISYIENLKSLTSLTLWNNEIKNISFLKGLESLTELSLANNKVNDASVIKELKSLTSLSLSKNQISDISFIKELKSLTSLDLSFNNQINDYSVIKELKSLIYLNLSNNQISDIPFIGELKSLTILNLSKNRIGDASFLKELKSLISLNLEVNQIRDASFVKELKYLYSLDLRKNEPLKKQIPEEILKDWENAQKIINYVLKTIEGETRPLNEAKIVVVGEAEFGKSLLIRRLIYDDFIDTKSTTGIKIEPWKDVRINNQNVRLNIWDFGGQEIMHSTHQFFFTKRTIYILVVNARRNEDRNTTEEWLERIKSFGGDSPIIIVGSKIDQNQRDETQEGQGYFEINRTELTDKFKNIRGFYGVCSDARLTKFDDKWTEFVNGLKAEIGNLKELHQPFPADWFAIKDQLEDMRDNDIPHISNSEYLKSCLKKNIEDETSQNTIREFLNDIGIIIYFKELFDRMIFNPEWITKGVYALTDNPVIIRNKGELEFSQLDKILSPKGYSSDEHKFILDLMRKFELCVEIEEGKRFLIPDLLLDVEEPFTGEWKNTLGFQYHYEIYLKNIFTRFVVRMYPYIYKKTWWQNGLVLSYEESKALIKFYSSEKKVKINISGSNIKNRQDLLAIIRKEFREIYNEFKSFNFTEFVAHPTIKLSDEKGREIDILKDYEELRGIEASGKSKEIYVKELKKHLLISAWLDGIESKEERLRNNSLSEEASSPEFTAVERDSPLIQAKINLDDLEKRKNELDVPKKDLDTKAEVWATVIRWLIGVLLFGGLIYLIYWCVQNIEWIESRWTRFEIGLSIFGIVVLISPIIFFLFRKINMSEELTVNWIESKIQKRLYNKHNFDLPDYVMLCSKIERKETEIKKLR